MDSHVQERIATVDPMHEPDDDITIGETPDDDEVEGVADLDSVERELKAMLEGADLGQPAARLVGETIGGTYRITEELGEGGMGKVFLAEHARTGGQVALKLIKSSRLSEDNAIRRFELEAKHTAALHHPNIVHVFDYGEDDDLFYLAMEYVPGRSLEELLREEGPFDWRRVVAITEQILKALAAAHQSERQLIHRDIKPANILLTDGDAFVKVLDFGIARALEGPAATTHGIIGSPQTMAPEQFDGGPITPATDLYALGCTVYAMLTGRPPFEGSFSQLAMKHCHEDPAPLRTENNELPPHVVDWVDWLMQKAPADRPTTAEEALEHLRLASTGTAPASRGRPGEPPRGARPWRWGAGLAMAGAVAAAVWMGADPPGNGDGGAASLATAAGDPDAGESITHPATGSRPVTGLEQVSIDTLDVPIGVTDTVAVSRQGNFLAFTRVDEQTLNIRTLSTGQTTTLPIPDGKYVATFTWAPDGTSLLATLGEGEHQEVWTVDLLEKRWSMLVENSAGAELSPDGTELMFVSGHTLFTSSADGTDTKSVLTVPADTRLQQFFWLDAENAIVALSKHVDAMRGEGQIVHVSLESGEVTELIDNPRLPLSGTIHLAVVGRQTLIHSWRTRDDERSQVAVLKLDGSHRRVTEEPVPIFTADRGQSVGKFSASSDGRFFFAIMEARSNVWATRLERDPLRIGHEVGLEGLTGIWVTPDTRIVRTKEGSDSIVALHNVQTDELEVLHRFQDRDVVPFAMTRSMGGLVVFNKLDDRSKTGRLLWYDDIRDLSGDPVVIEETYTLSSRVRFRCTFEPQIRCFRIRMLPGRIEAHAVTGEGIAGKPTLSVPGPNPPTGDVDLSFEPPGLIVGHPDRVEVFDLEGELQQTWRPWDSDSPARRLQRFLIDPRGGFFVSGIFPTEPVYRLLHVSDSGEETTLLADPGKYVVLRRLSTDGSYLEYGQMEWDVRVATSTLPEPP